MNFGYADIIRTRLSNVHNDSMSKGGSTCSDLLPRTSLNESDLCKYLNV